MKRVLAILFGLLIPTLALSAPLELKPGDHISLIGNSLAERMQHHGRLETLIQARFPDHKLVFRNLGFAADVIDPNQRMRSQDFGSPDKWLTLCKTDVIFAFFGYNESFAGAEGIPQFKATLDAQIKAMLKQQYNGKSAPRIVLFSPIGHEDLHDRNLPDGKENNPRIKLYTEAMAEVAQANNVLFIDLFTPSLELYTRARKPLTINGIHLSESGDRELAPVIDQALFGPIQPGKWKVTEGDLEKLNAAVTDKNFYWFNRYRTLDGYSIYGGRADLRFVNGQTNRDVAQREMQILDAMTANRDPKIWAIASGNNYTVDDNNTPSFIPVITNKPGPLPGGKHLFLSGEEEIKRMTVGKNLKVTLFASEKEFPELTNAVQMAFDPKGRLWVAVWPSYPHWKPKEPMNDKLLILEDTNGDGVADKCTTFADGLHCPTGFEFYNGGVLVAQAPYLMFLKDTRGTGKADFRERLLSSLDSADTHHTSNSFVLDPGGAVYMQEGTFHQTQVETPYGPPQRNSNAGVFRYEPRTQKFAVYVTYGFANPHGHVFDRWGQDIVVDGTGSNPYHAALFSGYLPFPEKHQHPPQVYQQRTRPCPGMEFLSSNQFPEEWQGNLLVANVIGFQGILRYKMIDNGASFSAIEQEPILSSNDPNFRPSDLKIGPDGAIWFIDWHNPIIGHMQHNLRDPSRDREHGRIYRITYESQGNGKRKPASSPVAIAGEPIEKLLDVLREPEDRVRYRARIELAARKTEEVIPAAKKWLASLDTKDADFEHHQLEALWLHQSHNTVDEDLLHRNLAANDFRARAAATRVLSYWRDRVPGSLELLKKLAADPHPRVRLEAVRASSFYQVPEAIEVALVAAELPSDQYLDFIQKETHRALDPIWKRTLDSGKTIAVTTDAGAHFLLRNLSVEQLQKLKPTRAVNLELLYRPGVRDELRRAALQALAKEDNKPELRMLIDAVNRLDERIESRNDQTLFDLIRMLNGRGQKELAEIRADLEKLALSAKLPTIRQIGYVALANIDGSADKIWTLALKSPGNLRDLINAVPVLSDPNVRAALYPKLEALLSGLPDELGGPNSRGKTLLGRTVRVELPGNSRTLTLAEVEVFSDGINIARKGKATQKNTGYGGEANRAIDGNRSPSYSDNGQTHTQEGTANPWWQVDLGGEFPIDRIVIYNRNDGLSNRLDNFTLKVLNGENQMIWEKTKQPAPQFMTQFEVGTDSPERYIRRAVMTGLTSVRGQEGKTFQLLAKRMINEDERLDAIRAIQRIPRGFWDKSQAQPLLDLLLTAIRKVPARERTGQNVLDSLEMADALTTLLPPDSAAKVRAELGELGVRVIRIGTVLERMAYDKDVVVVKAGKPVEFIFENLDLMPHNLVITNPGALQVIGEMAESTAQQPDAQARHFVPRSEKILLASTLLQPREIQRLSFVAPTQPGVYPIVCTYPGHWRRMYASLYVVSDLDGYLANPDAYLANNPVTIKDDLLKDRRPRTEWKYDDLSTAVKEMKGRSFASGKSMFGVSSCISCHKMEGVGNEFGPDLTKLDAKVAAPTEILRHILEPSLKIDDKYVTWIFETKKGQTISGMILSENDDEVKIIENPLSKAEPRALKKADLEGRTKSPISLMPKGLLDKLSRDEILDLIAYIAAKGQKEHPYFSGDGHDHHH